MPAEAPAEMLADLARRFGTPLYAYDLTCVRDRVARVHAVLPPGVGLLYSVKANPSLGLCEFLAGCGVGADVASVGELVTAIAAGFPSERIFQSGPHKSAEALARLRDLPEVCISVDSLDELAALAGLGFPNRLLLRLRPHFRSRALVPVGPESRFGVPIAALGKDLGSLTSGVVGFHVFAGSQVLRADDAIAHLHGAAELCLRAADALQIQPTLLNLGGGFGIPYGEDEADLDLGPVGEALAGIAGRLRPARIVLELGRYLVAPAGWYLTSVLGRQTFEGRPAVVVDGGTHQRGDLCALDLRRARPPVLLRDAADEPAPTSVLGCLSAPGDILADGARLPSLGPGDVLAFPNAGAYGLAASPHSFHAAVPPAEVAFDGDRVTVLRARRPPEAVLQGQCRGDTPATGDHHG